MLTVLVEPQPTICLEAPLGKVRFVLLEVKVIVAGLDPFALHPLTGSLGSVVSRYTLAVPVAPGALVALFPATTSLVCTTSASATAEAESTSTNVKKRSVALLL